MKIRNLNKYCKVDTVKDEFLGLINVVKYKEIELWTTIYTDLTNCEISLIDSNDGEYTEYTIMGETKVCGLDEYDITFYGCWETLEEANEWLENPCDLY